MKKFIPCLVLMMVLLSACGSGAGDSAAGGAQTSAVVGQDLSGIYRPTDIMCVNSAGTSVVAQANFSSNSPVETFTISGNSFIDQSNTSTCGVTMQGTIQLTQQGSDSNSQWGSFSMTFSSVAVTGTSSCTLTTTLVPVSGSPAINPSPITQTYTNGQSVAPISSATYIYTSTHILAVFMNMQVSGQPTALCFERYSRIN